jgi:NAD(P) transhydrogenase subunit beta
MSVHNQTLLDYGYLLAAITFIIGLKRLGSPATARSGNRIAAVGMLVGLIATLLERRVMHFGLIAVGVVIGVVLGVPAARKVKMTAMPQMVALFNGVGGGCVALISLAEYHDFRTLFDKHVPLNLFGPANLTPAHVIIGTVAGAIIGTISFSGSIIAFLKLQELISGRPITWPVQTPLNGLMLLAVLGGGVWIVLGASHKWGVNTPPSMVVMEAMVLIAFVLGMCFVLPVGGADMPVIISLLNSFTGLAAAMAGFALANSLLIISGTLVGASGFLLTKLMGEAMNRPITNVLFGAFGGGGGGSGGAALAGETGGTVRSATADDVAIMLAYARQVVVVPGYGLAVAQAQHTIRELADLLAARGVEVKYGIHPVAGRMPGHMNVLLAEANVPYEQLKEMDEINPEFRQTDVVLVIGANDVVNPAAKEIPESPLYGMPILNVDEAQAVVVLKRSMASGFAGVENPLFFKPNTQMLFGDAKASISELVTAVKDV